MTKTIFFLFLVSFLNLSTNFSCAAGGISSAASGGSSRDSSEWESSRESKDSTGTEGSPRSGKREAKRNYYTSLSLENEAAEKIANLERFHHDKIAVKFYDKGQLHMSLPNRNITRFSSGKDYNTFFNNAKKYVCEKYRGILGKEFRFDKFVILQSPKDFKTYFGTFASDNANLKEVVSEGIPHISVFKLENMSDIEPYKKSIHDNYEKEAPITVVFDMVKLKYYDESNNASEIKLNKKRCDEILAK